MCLTAVAKCGKVRRRLPHCVSRDGVAGAVLGLADGAAVLVDRSLEIRIS